MLGLKRAPGRDASLPRSDRLRSLFFLETGSGWRVPELDGLRAIAALMVLFGHSYKYSDRPSIPIVTPLLQSGGRGGVLLFFALSGFLLYLPWVRGEEEGTGPPSLRTYALRRCLRIMPAYYVCVVALFLIRRIQRGFWSDPVDLGLHLVFLPLFGHAFLSVFWTLQVEEFFYWSLPGLHRLFRRGRERAGLAVTAVVTLGYGLLVVAFANDPRWQGVLLLETPFFLVAFGLGMTSAVWWVRRRSSPDAWKLVLGGAVGYLVLAQISSYAVDHHASNVTEIWLRLAFAPFASMIVLGVARGGLRQLAVLPLRIVGAISYSLYLWHEFLIRSVSLPGGRAPGLLTRLVLDGAMATAVAMASFLVVERPFLLLRPRLRPRREPTGQGPVTHSAVPEPPPSPVVGGALDDVPEVSPSV